MQQTSNKTHLILYHHPSLVTTIVLLLTHSNLQELQRFYTVFISCTYLVFGPLPCVNIVNNQANNHSKLFQFSALQSDRRLILQVLLIIIEAFVKLW